MNKKFKGTVKNFNGKFGFLKSELGDTFFHKSGIVGNISINKGDEVEFKTEPSIRVDGGLQGIEITLIKKFENPSIEAVNPIIGILEWFDVEKGFGVIATPATTDYFLHKSNFHSKNLFIETGDVLVFVEKTERGKKVASKCKPVENFEDFKIALSYLYKDDIVTLKCETREEIFGSFHYSTQIEKISLLEQAVTQILRDKATDDKLKFISMYFREKLFDRPSEEQQKYFNFVKNVFGNNVVQENIKILNSFFCQHIEFFRNDSEIIYTLWLEGCTEEKDLSYIAKKIEKEPYGYYQNKFKRIFERLTEPDEQHKVVEEFLEIIGTIDGSKYQKIKSIAGLLELDEKVRKKFLISAYGQSDFETQYLMWLEGFVQEKDLSYIAEEIAKIGIGLSVNPFKRIFKRLTEPNEQHLVIKEFLEIIGTIDGSKYQKIKSIAGLSELDEKVREGFLTLSYGRSDIERQYLMWLEGFVQEKDLNYIVEKIKKETIGSQDGKFHSTFKEIFMRLTKPSEQDIVIKEFLKKIGNIDHEKKYRRIKSICDLSELDEKVREDFLTSAYGRSDIERQYLMWLEGYVQEKDLSYIAEKIEKETISPHNNNYHTHIEEIFERLTVPNEQKVVIKVFLEKTGRIDDEDKFKRICYICSLSGLDEKVRKDFLTIAYGQSDIERQFKMWLEGFVKEKDLNYIIEKIEKEVTGCHYSKYHSAFKKILGRLTEPNELDMVIRVFLEKFGIINNEEKYQSIKSIDGLSELDAKVREDFLISVYGKCDTHYKVKHFLDYSQFIERDRTQQIIDLFNRLDVTAFYSFCINLINPHFEMYIKYGFSYNILTNNNFKTKISFFKIISSYIESNFIKIKESAKAIMETGDFDLISMFLKNLQAFNDINTQICSDLQIEKSRIPAIESFLIDICSKAQLLKFWVYGLIEYFDFSTYCHYYFTLTSEERKIFNKKAKAKMGEEIKASMFKKREPWQFIEKVVFQENQELEIYTASWKSIWFEDGSIRVCMNSNPSFSQQFKWDFSEEKFNFLYEYISGKRLKDLKITAKDDVIKGVEGLDELEELIWKILIIQEVEDTNGTRIKSVGLNRIPVNMLLRNQCVQLLNLFQLKELEPTRVLEKTYNHNNGGIGVDVSLLYSIAINEFEVAIIWESLELEKAKATHIFKCLRNEYQNIFSEIEYYLTGTLKVRSSLNSKDDDAISQQKKLRYLCRIEHDNFSFEKWENSLYEILPELKSFGLAKV